MNLFERDGHTWWENNSPFDLLHGMTPLRVRFIQKHFPHLKDLKILDVGCGGGALCEPLARLGAHVLGIDESPSTIQSARDHQPPLLENLDYICTSLDHFTPEKLYDVVIALEIIEHVTDPVLFIDKLLSCLQPNGALVLSTLNKTYWSYLGAILGAEYIFGWVPKGTHDWHNFYKPSDIDGLLTPHNYGFTDLVGLSLNIWTKKWSFSKDLSINYMGIIQKIS